MNHTIIAVIYNPNSTGSSKTMAEDFQKDVESRMPEQTVKLYPTKYAGHAEKIAYKLAKSSKKPVILSASGDGGYNEVVNGAMKAINKGYKPITGLLPSGNANDHYHNVHTDDIIDLMIAGKPKRIDVLKMAYVEKKKTKERYAHSYIGFGISSMVGKELNKTDLNKFNEIWLVIRTLFTVNPVKLKFETKVGKYDSVIISNVDRMSKYLTVSQPSSMSDGLFEVTISKHENKLKLVGLLLQASLVKLKEDKQANTFALTTVDQTVAQADGEIITIDADTRVDISIEKQVLSCYV